MHARDGRVLESTADHPPYAVVRRRPDRNRARSMPGRGDTGPRDPGARHAAGPDPSDAALTLQCDMSVTVNENAALAIIFRLYKHHSHVPFWLPVSEFPIKSLEYAVN